MPVYTVHAPASFGVDVRTTPDKVVFVRDGFSVWAFLAAPLWLIVHRLWLALLGYIVVNLAIEYGLRFLQAGSDTRLAAMIVLALFMGLEASSLWRWTLTRRKWRQLDVVVARNREAAEARFFDRFKSAAAPSQMPLPRASLTRGDDFFPMPGAAR